MGLLLLTRNSATHRATQKPRQWGPLGAVQAAVRHNAERLGIDSATLALILPLWEQAGAPTDLSDYKHQILLPASAPATWIPRGVSFTATTRAYAIGHATTAPPSLRFGWADDLTIFAYLNPDRAGNGDYFIGQSDYIYCGKRSSNGTPHFFFRTDTSSAYIYSTASWPTGPTAVVARKRGTVLDLFLNGVSVKDGQSGTPSSGNGVSFEWAFSGQWYDSTTDVWDGEIYTLFVARTGITDNTVGMLSERPYALLEPVARPLVFDLGAGGVSYSVSVSDGWAAGDGLGAAAILGAWVSDGLSASDGEQGLAGYAAVLSDGVAISDASAYETGIAVSVADGMTLADLPAAIATKQASVADGITLSDALAAAAALHAALADGINLSDAPIGVILGTIIEAMVADGVMTADQAERALALAAQLADGLALSDATTLRTDFTVTVDDGAQFGDALSAIFRFLATVSDGFAAGDTPRVVMTGEGAVITLYAKDRVWRFEVKARTFWLSAKTH